LVALKEQVHEDNLERQRLLKRFADNPSLELHLAHNGVIVLKLFLDLSQGTAQALSRSHRRAAAETVANPPAGRGALRKWASRLTPTATLIYFVHIRRHATDLSDSDSQATILTYSRPA